MHSKQAPPNIHQILVINKSSCSKLAEVFSISNVSLVTDITLDDTAVNMSRFFDSFRRDAFNFSRTDIHYTSCPYTVISVKFAEIGLLPDILLHFSKCDFADRYIICTKSYAVFLLKQLAWFLLAIEPLIIGM